MINIMTREKSGKYYVHYKVLGKEYYVGPYVWKECLWHSDDIKGYEGVEWTSIVPEEAYERSKQDSANSK